MNLLMRHPESEQNATGLKMFDIGDPDLSPLGHLQGHAAGQYLEELHSTEQSLDVIICSPAKRALLGGLIVQRYMPDVPLKVDKRLSEINWGEWAGRLQAEVMTKEVQEQADAEGLEFCPPGGVSMLEAYNDFQDVRGAYAGYNTLMVSHGFKMKSLFAGSLALSRQVARKIPVANAELLQFEPVPGLVYPDPEMAIRRIDNPRLPAVAA